MTFSEALYFSTVWSYLHLSVLFYAALYFNNTTLKMEILHSSSFIAQLVNIIDFTKTIMFCFFLNTLHCYRISYPTVGCVKLLELTSC